MVGKGGQQVGDKGMARDVLENLAFVTDVVNLLELDDSGLAEDLEGKDLAGLFFVARLLSADQDDTCKGTCA